MIQRRLPVVLATLATIAAVAPATGFAQDTARPVLIYGVAGTGGVGIGVGTQISERWVIRGEVARLTRSTDKSNDRINYSGDLKLSTGAILADYHLFDGGFRLTGGIDFGRPRAQMRALTRASTLTVNDRDYAVPPGEGLEAEVRYPRAMPYVGIGWGFGNLKQSGWKFGVDLGAAIGRARGELKATNGLMSVSGFPSDLAVQNQKFDNDARKLKAFPIIRVAVGYAF